MGGNWRGALVVLQDAGWGSAEIDAACEHLAEACLVGAFDDFEIHELTPAQVRSALGVAISDRLSEALTEVARVRSQGGPEAGALAEVLYDLDAFVAGS